MKKFSLFQLSFLTVAFAFILSSCNDGKSYSEMLRDEEIAVNWFLSGNRVEVNLPADGNFICGDDAPYYRMDGDGNVYMKVINPGNPDNRPQKGDLVYFRFMRANLQGFYEYGSFGWSGNAENMNSSLNGTSLTFGNTTLTSTTQYGTGIQVPLYYLGYDCRVMLVVKSVEGWSGDISNCIPYLYDIRYFKAEY